MEGGDQRICISTKEGGKGSRRVQPSESSTSCLLWGVDWGRDISGDMAKLKLTDGPRVNSPVVANSPMTAANRRGSQPVRRSTSRQVKEDTSTNTENKKPGVWTPGIIPPHLQ